MLILYCFYSSLITFLYLFQIIFWGCGILKILFVAMVILTLIADQRGYLHRVSAEMQGVSSLPLPPASPLSPPLPLVLTLPSLSLTLPPLPLFLSFVFLSPLSPRSYLYAALSCSPTPPSCSQCLSVNYPGTTLSLIHSIPASQWP